MKEKIITIKPKGINQKQWAVFLLELNLIKKAWKTYGVEVQISAPGFKKTVAWGTKPYYADTRSNSNRVQQDKRPKA
jgi:hypothetical protein|tara:strand:- start:295 stop:525 length:231 start_codon:yes stop_codon:yes gene_type:complete